MAHTSAAGTLVRFEIRPKLTGEQVERLAGASAETREKALEYVEKLSREAAGVSE